MIVLIFFLGAVFGSFFLVIGTRLPKKEDVIFKSSACDNCHHKLSWYELIPILSYIFLLGKCKRCKKRISIDHLVLEIASGLLFLVGYLYYGLTLQYLIYLVSVSVSLIVFVSDFKYMVILDSPIIIGSMFLIIIRYFEVGLQNTLISILYGLILFAVMYLMKLLGDFLFKKESLGGGDIKLSFFIGLLLGYYGIGFKLGLISIIFSAFLALPYAMLSVYLNKKNELPFGPFLIASSIIVFVFIEKFSRLFIFFS